MFVRSLSYIFILLLVFSTGCGKIDDLEEVKGSKATSGQTLFVDPDYAGDAANGTEMFPFNGIQAAIDAASNGQTIFIKGHKDGDKFYEQPIYINNKTVHLVGDGTTEIIVHLDPALDPKTRGMIIFDGPQSNGSISGFELSHDEWYDGTGIICKNGASPRIHGNIIYWHFNGIAVYSGADPIIENNLIEGNKYGIKLYGDTSPVHALIRDNRIFRNRSYAGDIGDRVGILLVDNAVADIFNNYICENRFGIYIKGDPCTANIINNLIANNDMHGIKFPNFSDPHRAVIYNNIIHGQTNGVGVFSYNTVSASVYYNSFTGNNDNMLFVADEGSNTDKTPQFIDTEKYQLDHSNYLYSELGDPASNYNDKDGSRNDIGPLGGPHAN